MIRTERLIDNINIVPHVLESGFPDIICMNICSAAAPRGTPRHRYAGTSCPAPRTRRYENVPAFLYRPGLPLTLYVPNFCLANSAENLVFKEATCANNATGSVQGLEKELRKSLGCAHYGLNAHIVDNVICISSIDHSAHGSIDGHLEVWARRTHRVTGHGELVVYVVVALNPRTLSANLGRHC
jgi:hypothetical protein